MPRTSPPPDAVTDEALDVPGRKDPVLRLAAVVLSGWREQAGLTQDQLTHRVQYSKSQVMSVELGRRSPSTRYLRAADEACGAGGMLLAMDPHIRQRPASYEEQDLVSLEASSTLLSYYAPCAVPRLFHPGPDAPDHGPSPAVTSKAVLASGRPVCLVLDESVLQRDAGDRTAHRRQLLHLAELAERRHITVQVLPVDIDDDPGITAPVCLLRKGDDQYGYVDTGLGVLWLRPERVRIAEQRFATLRSLALPPRISRDLIRSAAESTHPADPAAR